MVGYDPTSTVHLTQLSHGLAGAASGVVTRAVSQPLDVLKIRFQLQVEPILKGHHGAKYHSMLQACLVIHREEGVRAFWKGHIPAQVLSVIFGIVQFTVFEVLTQQVSNELPDTLTSDLKPVTHFVCGSLAGCAATLAAQPFDVIRTRFVAQGRHKVYHTMLHATRCMLVGEGPRALYKGLLPALVQIAPQNGFQFSFYSIFKGVYEHLLLKSGEAVLAKKRPGNLESIVCGSGAGICAKVIVYPLDMIKKRLQIVGFAEGRAAFGRTRTYSGLMHCLRTVVIEEGVRGLYKGLRPSVVKAMVTVGCSFWAYELFCNLMLQIQPEK